jgi:NAD(P)-dependent dehydrogenase (short-subunit alcohol dehydrogenase family)
MTVDLGLNGKRALVTGAGVGIGRGIARWLAKAGCDVAVADKDGEMLDDAVAEVAFEGTRVLGVEADLRRPDAVRDLVDRVVGELGGLDVAVNNVGSLAGRMPGHFVELDDEALRDIVEQNLFVTMWSCHAEARAMVAAQTAGVIVNVSSGETTRPAVRMAPYGAAKAGINHLTQTLAVELAPHGIRVNAVAPAVILTEMTRPLYPDQASVDRIATRIPMGRLGLPGDVAGAVVFLASELAAYVTGGTVTVDGGYMVR